MLRARQAQPIEKTGRRNRRRARLIAGLLGAAVAPVAAFAGAWTLPPGEGQIIASVLGWAGLGSPYGGAPAPKENRVATQIYGEYGLYDHLTLFGQISAERYALSAPSSDVYRGFDYTLLGLRENLWSDDEGVISFEGAALAPGASDLWRPAQAGNTGGAVEARLLAGRNFMLYGIPGFFDAQIGYRFRSAGPPDEWHGDITIGLKWTPEWMGMAQIFNVVSAASADRDFPAWSAHTAEVSVVHALDAHWSIQVGGFASFASVRTNSERGVVAAVWRKF